MAVLVTQDRQVAGHAVEGLGHDVHVLDRMKRNRDPREQADLARPEAGAVDHYLARDVARARRDTDRGASRDLDPGDLDLLEDLDAARAGASGQRGGHLR